MSVPSTPNPPKIPLSQITRGLNDSWFSCSCRVDRPLKLPFHEVEFQGPLVRRGGNGGDFAPDSHGFLRSPQRLYPERCRRAGLSPNFAPSVPLTAASRPARVPWGKCRVGWSGQSSRSQFQIGKSFLRSRRLCRRSPAQSRGGQVLTLTPLPTNHSRLATAFSNRNIPELEFDLAPSIVSNLKFSNRHTFARSTLLDPRRRGPFHSLPAPAPCPKIKWNTLRAVLSPSLEEPRP
jgi:hypothetical protein